MTVKGCIVKLRRVGALEFVNRTSASARASAGAGASASAGANAMVLLRQVGVLEFVAQICALSLRPWRERVLKVMSKAQ